MARPERKVPARRRPRRHAERGDGKIGAIIALLVVVFVVYVLMKVIPVRVAKAEIAEEVERAAQEYAVNAVSYEELLKRIVRAAAEQEVALSEEGIRIEDGRSEIEVEVRYSVVLPMVWGEWKQDVHIEKAIPKL